MRYSVNYIKEDVIKLSKPSEYENQLNEEKKWNVNKNSLSVV